MAFLGSLEATLLDLSGQAPTQGPSLLLHRVMLPLTHGPLQSTSRRRCQDLLCYPLTFSRGRTRCWMAPAHFSLLWGQPNSDTQEILISSLSPAQVPGSVSNIPILLALHFYNFLRHESDTPKSALSFNSSFCAGTQIKLPKWFPWSHLPPTVQVVGIYIVVIIFSRKFPHTFSVLSSFKFLLSSNRWPIQENLNQTGDLFFVNGPYDDLVLEYNISWLGVCIETPILVFCCITRFSCEVCNKIIITIQGYTSKRNKAETWTQVFQLQTALSTLPWDREHLLEEK